MILLWLIVVLLVAGLLAWWGERLGPAWPRWVAVAALAADLLLGLSLWRDAGELAPLPALGLAQTDAPGALPPWLAELQVPWIPRFGISLHLAADGLSLVLVLLTLVLGLAAVVASWSEIRERVGFFHLNLLWSLAGVVGVFTALDLFLFFVWWEVMLVPMYLLISIWGHERRVYAGLKFFLFTQAGSLLMLLAILGLGFAHAQQTGRVSLDYPALLALRLDPAFEWWLMLAFFVAFAVKLPAFPFHPWLPDAHTEAPTGGSVLLAGLLLKTGAYGLLRFTIPLFPLAAEEFAPLAMTLGVVGVLYGALLAYAQTDLKRLVAYSSVSHLGFALLGIFSWNTSALQGALIVMIAHGFSTGALFMLVGAIQERLHTRDLRRMGGLWDTVPRLAALGLFFAVASLGLPGLGNFIGEVLVLLGAFQVSLPLAVLGTSGIVVAAVYALTLVQRAFHGPRLPADPAATRDVGWAAAGTLGAMAFFLTWIGLYPAPIVDRTAPAVAGLQALVAPERSAGAPPEVRQSARSLRSIRSLPSDAPGPNTHGPTPPTLPSPVATAETERTEQNGVAGP